jgi:hypothetical protein
MSNDLNVPSSIEICCPGCGEMMTLSPPKGKRKKLRLGLERTQVVCERCGKKFAYWGKLEHSMRFSLLRKLQYFIHLKIPEPSVSVDGAAEVHCSICGKIQTLLSLEPEPKLGLLPPKVKASCNTCGGRFTYFGRLETRKKSSPTGERRPCLYIEILDPVWQMKVWQHRLHCERT